MIYLFDRHLELRDVLSTPMTAILNRGIVKVDQIFIEDRIEMEDTIRKSDYAGVFYQSKFYIFRIIKKEMVNNKITIRGVNYAYDELANLKVIQDRRLTDVTGATAIQIAIDDTPWTLGTIETTSSNSTNFYYITPLQAIQKIIEIWGIEPHVYFEFDGKKITGRKIDVYQRQGNFVGERYVYGSDLLEVIHEENRTEIVTALYGRGKGEEILDDDNNPTGGYGRRLDFSDIVWSKSQGDPLDKPLGQEYLELPSATALYGYPISEGILSPRFDVFIDDQIEDKEELLMATYKDLMIRARPITVFKSSVAKAGPYELGDTNYVIRPDLNIIYEARIFEDQVDLLDPNKTTFNFGDYVLSGAAQRAKEIKGQFAGLTDKISNLDKQLKGQLIKVSEDWYDALMEAKSDNFFSSQSYNYSLDNDNIYGLPSGFYSFDAPIDGTPGPTGFLVIQGGKIGRGKVSPSGEWDFDLIGDADGITADAITAGKIKAQFIEIGSQSTFLEGYDPSEKANANDVFTKTEIETKFEVLDGTIRSTISSEVSEQIGEIGVYQIDLISTNGLVFKNDEIYTTIIARVYKNGIDITDEINANNFRWTKVDKDGNPDVAWNASNSGGRKQITISGEDVFQRATFKCEIIGE